MTHLGIRIYTGASWRRGLCPTPQVVTPRRWQKTRPRPPRRQSRRASHHCAPTSVHHRNACPSFVLALLPGLQLREGGFGCSPSLDSGTQCLSLTYRSHQGSSIMCVGNVVPVECHIAADKVRPGHVCQAIFQRSVSGRQV